MWSFRSLQGGDPEYVWNEQVMKNDVEVLRLVGWRKRPFSLVRITFAEQENSEAKDH